MTGIRDSATLTLFKYIPEPAKVPYPCQWFLSDEKGINKTQQHSRLNSLMWSQGKYQHRLKPSNIKKSTNCMVLLMTINYSEITVIKDQTD